MESELKPTYGVGYESNTVTGEHFVVVDYQGRKKILIRFDCGIEKNTTSTDIKHGRVKYCKRPSKYLFSVGDEVVSKEGVSGTVISVDQKRDRVRVLFGNEVVKTFSRGTLLYEDFSSKPHTSIKVGDRFETARYGFVTVTKYHSATKIDIVFDDGTPHTAHATCLRTGSVGHPKSGVPEGFSFVNKDGWEATVIAYHDPMNVDLKWQDGGITEGHTAANVNKGSIYYPNAKTVAGVGYFGVGKYKPNRSGGNINYDPVVYRKWYQMIIRCYSPYEINKDSCRAYKDVLVCEEWHNFQNFALWAEDRVDKFIDGFELDKDMFGTGYLYCPEYCTLLPDQVNGFLSNNYSTKSSGLPDGVNVVKPNKKYLNAKTGYIARCHIKGTREYLGFYDTPEEAAQVYREAKEGEARRLAEVYKDILTEREYEKLKSFTMEDIHRK